MPTRLPPQHTLRLYLAAPDCAAHHHAGLLDGADRAHLVRHPARAAQTSWQVSRFLKQQAAADGFSGSLYAVRAAWQRLAKNNGVGRHYCAKHLLARILNGAFR